MAALYVILMSTTSAMAQTSALPTRMIDVDGVLIHAVTLSTANRASDAPAVVFESGGGTPLEGWGDVLVQVSEFATVVAYDRSGTGRSEWDGLAPTPERVAARLRRLLDELGVAPPYVVVGHSWGGALARYFVGLHPDDVVGVLYLDPTDITQSPEDERALFASIGADPSARDAFYQLQERGLAAASAELRAEAEVVLDLMRSEVGARRLPGPPTVPSSVVLAGRPPVFPAGVLPFDAEAYAAAIQALRRSRLESWVQPPGRLMVATEAGHFVHVDAPDIVVEVIRELVRIER